MANVEQFGRGILCPFQRDGKGDFVNGDGLPVLRSDIGELLGIIGPSRAEPGEVPWRTDLGSRVALLKHRGIHKEMTRATAEMETSGTIRKWEPRVVVGPTEITSGELADTSLTVRVSFRPAGRPGAPADAVALKVKE
jgi:phage baseplate assembly protein W